MDFCSWTAALRSGGAAASSVQTDGGSTRSCLHRECLETSHFPLARTHAPARMSLRRGRQRKKAWADSKETARIGKGARCCSGLPEPATASTDPG